MKTDSKRIGETCPKCMCALVRRPGAFFWRGEFRDGAYCEDCNALWAIDGEEIPPLRPASPEHEEMK